MSNNPEDLDDIPEVEVIGKKIKLGTTLYDLIMYYECPVCHKPLIAYWTVPGNDNRATENIVGRALRDSGFGGYRFFGTANGQGFEYDPEKDPRKRHQHGQREKRYWGGEGEYTQLWNNYLKHNPLYNINEFLSDIMAIAEYKFKKGHLFVSNQAQAIEIIENMTSRRADAFKLIDDKIGHGKEMFFFDIIEYRKSMERAWNERTRIEKLVGFIGEETIMAIDDGGRIKLD